MRRAQLVAPFGTGAITVVPDGTALITAGLDHWFERDSGLDNIDIEEFQIEEWRLEKALRVNHFRLPPDYRTKRFGEKDVQNLLLTVPSLRFPRWNFCRRCKTLQHLPLHFKGRKRCEECEKSPGKLRAPIVAQVPFIALCEYGHVRDFPWREWVHKSLKPSCAAPLRLRSTGGASLAAQSVECGCGKKRNLARITEAAPLGSEDYPNTYLSSNLSDDGEYLCSGGEPWNSRENPQGCGRPVRGSLRAASNVYFALVKSSIYLPRGGTSVPENLVQILVNPPISTVIHTIRSLGLEPEPVQLRAQQHGNLLKPFTDLQIRRGLGATALPAPVAEPDSEEDEPGDETEFRRPEFAVLREEHDSDELLITRRNLSDYIAEAVSPFSRIMLIDKLRETRALWGFNRVYPEGSGRLRDRKAMLWQDAPEWQHSWLPAYVVHGEGLFLEFDAKRLAAWEEDARVIARVEGMRRRYESVQKARRLRQRDLTPRFVLLHTFAHLLMNQLTYESGYSSAALRERLYISGGGDPMAAILIYTAAGDAEGTMGGLVRMGKPGYLEPAMLDALRNADWCSADPVCMEIGDGGQGPDSCNMAACHNCALVPETACEEFNRFLDRGLVIGTHKEPGIGFFVR